MLKKIGVFQFVVMLYLARTFSTLTYNLGTVNNWNGSVLFVGAIFSLIIQIAVILPPIFLYYSSDKKDVIDCCYSLFGKSGHIVSFLYSLAFMLICIFTITNTVFLMDNAIYKNSNSTFTIIVFILACVYASASGLEAISRSATLLFFLFIFLMVILFISLSSEVQLFNFRPILDNPVSQIAKSSYNTFAMNSELLGIIFLLPYTKGNAKKGIVWFFILIFVTFELVAFYGTAVIGSYSNNTVFPFYTLVSVPNLSSGENLDAVHFAVWVFMSFIKVSFYLHMAAKTFKKIIPEKGKKLALPIAALIILIFSTLTRYSIQYIAVLTSIINSGIVQIAFVFLMPLILLIALKIKKEKINEKKDCSGNVVANTN